MSGCHCPNCGSKDVVSRMVNDRLWAADPRGAPFEIPLRVLVWSCNGCRLCWQGEEAMAAREIAYQNALGKRSHGRTAAN
jgi:hypothetical protein